MASTPITQRKADEQITRLVVLSEGIQKEVEKIDQIKLDVSELRTRFEAICDDNKKIKETIFGNGKSGLKDDVSHLQSRMKVITWAAGVVGSSLIVFSVGLWLYLVVTYGAVALP